MCKYQFKSIFASYFEGYLRMKHSMGFNSGKFRYFFKELDVVFIKENANKAVITKELVLAWRASRLNDSERTLYDKWSILAQFCRYMCHIGHPCHVPRLPGKKDWFFIPHIFTHEQMAHIFRAADSLRMPYLVGRSNHFSMPVLIRLLYATGMRIGEAISLNNEDINMDKRLILIRKSKNQQQRFIPISDTLAVAIVQYLHYNDKSPFLISLDGSRLSKCAVSGWFRKILKVCGIPFVGGNHGPRIHDIRHTCAVHTLMAQVNSGADIYCIMPVLSVFLGHKTLAGTEKYIRLTQEMFPDISIRMDELSSFIYPTLSSIRNSETV